MDHDAYLTRAQAAMLLRVTPATVSHWRARGWLDTQGRRCHLSTRPGGGGRLTYRLGDLMQAYRDTAANHRSHRRLAVDAPQVA